MILITNKNKINFTLLRFVDQPDAEVAIKQKKNTFYSDFVPSKSIFNIEYQKLAISRCF